MGPIEMGLNGKYGLRRFQQTMGEWMYINIEEMELVNPILDPFLLY
jgi:hypothetical protein